MFETYVISSTFNTNIHDINNIIDKMMHICYNLYEYLILVYLALVCDDCYEHLQTQLEINRLKQL